MPNLRGYVSDLFQTPGVAASVNLDHIKVCGAGGHVVKADCAVGHTLPMPSKHTSQCRPNNGAK